MEHLLDLSMILQSNPFTFVVGVDEVEITLHEAAISRESRVLETNMRWSTSEQGRKPIKLPEVDVATFIRFANFCYTRNYEGSNFTTARKTEDQRVLDDVKQEGGFSCFKCGKFVVGREKYHLFPFCAEPCNAGNTPGDMVGFCPMCSNQNISEQRTMCTSCDDPFQRRANHEPCRKWCKLNGFLQIAGVPKSMLSNVEHVVNPDAITGGLLSHAKAVVFAEVYECIDLKIMALAALGRDITGYPVQARTVLNVVELLEYVYDNTQDNDDYGDGSTDILREVVNEFAADHISTLLRASDFKGLLAGRADLAVDLLKTTAEKGISVSR